MSDKKLISFCITGRNDNYLGNFNYRIKTAINYLARSAKILGALDQIEILITDWNSEKPLSGYLELSPEAASIAYFISVPPQIARKYHQQYKGQEFNSTCATNAAVRRAGGSYIIIMPADCFFSPVALQNFIKVISGETKLPYDVAKCLLKISRRMIPYHLWEAEPDVEKLESCLADVSGKLAYSPDTAPDITSGLGGIVASRNLWHLAHGFDERVSGWGHSDTEFGLRIEQIYPSQELSHYGVWVYDLAADMELAQNNQRERINPQIYHNKIEVNPVDWGLGNEPLKMERQSEESVSCAEEHKKEEFSFKGRDELISQMASKECYSFLKARLPFLKVFRLNWRVFYPLIWYGLKFRPNKYLELGVSDASGAPIVALVDKHTSIFISFQNSDRSTGVELSPLDIFAFLKAAGEGGRCRFIEGDLDTVFERITNCFGSKVYFDLILFQPDLYQEKAFDLLTDTMEHLLADGAVVISSNSPESFRVCWEEAKKKYPLCTYVHCFRDEVGVILNSKLRSESEGSSEAREMEVLKKSWRPIKKSMIAYVCAYGFDLLAGLFRKCYYENFWRWPVAALGYCSKCLRNRSQD